MGKRLAFGPPLRPLHLRRSRECAVRAPRSHPGRRRFQLSLREASLKTARKTIGSGVAEL
jgi:hypothetical protein